MSKYLPGKLIQGLSRAQIELKKSQPSTQAHFSWFDSAGVMGLGQILLVFTTWRSFFLSIFIFSMTATPYLLQPLDYLCRDLSFNNLSGQLPESLFNLSQLTYLQWSLPPQFFHVLPRDIPSHCEACIVCLFYQVPWK